MKSDPDAVSNDAANGGFGHAADLSGKAIAAKLGVQDCTVGQELAKLGLRIVGDPCAFRF